MSKLEITIDKADEFILAMIRLAEALENKMKPMEVTANEPNEIADPLEEEPPITSEQINKEEKPVTLEQVRAVLTVKKDEGKNKAIKELLQKYGTTKLTTIDPAKYAELFKEAEAL